MSIDEGFEALANHMQQTTGRKAASLFSAYRQSHSVVMCGYRQSIWAR